MYFFLPLFFCCMSLLTIQLSPAFLTFCFVCCSFEESIVENRSSSSVGYAHISNNNKNKDTYTNNNNSAAIMFGRRVASSCGIPANMYTRLHISSAKQAKRMLPPLVPVTSLVSSSVSGGIGLFASFGVGGEVVPSDLSSPANILSLLGMTPRGLLTTINASPLLLRMLSDTMSTYSVILPHSSC